MSNHRTPPDLGEALNHSHLLSNYEQLATAVIDAHPDDVGQQLPGLADQIASLSQEREDLREFIVGISYTHRYSLFDYELYEVREKSSDELITRVIKEPVSENHHYISFVYPADPRFDNVALRGVILAELNRRIRELSGIDDQDDPTFADVWESLAYRVRGPE